MPVRTLFSSFLLALILLAATSTAADAHAKHPKAKIALVAKKHKAKKKAKKRPAAKTSKIAKTPAPAPAPAAPAAPVACANTDLVPDAGNLELIRAALQCLHNQVRAQNGLGGLTDNGALDAAGLGHSADMVTRGYFDHFTPEGGTFVDRILAARYAGADDAWTLGENLAWGTGANATPAGLMNAWMNSPEHRANILKPAYRELGLGLQLGTPSGDSAGITVSAEFGSKL